MLERLHAIRRKNRLPSSKIPENLEIPLVLRRRNGAAPKEVLWSFSASSISGDRNSRTAGRCCHWALVASTSGSRKATASRLMHPPPCHLLGRPLAIDLRRSAFPRTRDHDPCSRRDDDSIHRHTSAHEAAREDLRHGGRHGGNVPIACCMLHAACCMLHAACCMQAHIAT